MSNTELAARRYIAAWSERDPAARAALLDACFALDGRICVGGRVIAGRAALANEIDDVLGDPRGLTARLTSGIDAAGSLFRFRAAVMLAGGAQLMELLDAAEVDGDGRIAALYTFVEPLAPARDGDAVSGDAIATAPVLATELAMRRYAAAWMEPDPAARTALLEACFAASGRMVTPGRTLRGRTEIAALIDGLLASRGAATIRITSVIDGVGAAFRVGSEGWFGDHPRPGDVFESLDVGELDREGRIAVLYAFPGPLPAAP